MRRFHRISNPDTDTYLSFNPEKIEFIKFSPTSDGFLLDIFMTSGAEHTIHKENREEALTIFARLTGSPPPDSNFDDIGKSFFPAM